MTKTGIIDLGDGRELVFTIRQKEQLEKVSGQTLKDIWKPGSPFSYGYLFTELNRNGVINKDGKWTLYPIRGNHPTCSVHVRALYEALLYYNCIDELSFPQVQQIFNNTFTTDIKCSKVIENKNRCIPEYDYFNTMFAAFANADTNADSD